MNGSVEDEGLKNGLTTSFGHTLQFNIPLIRLAPLSKARNTITR